MHFAVSCGMNGLLYDIRYALRLLVKNRLFTLAVLLTLGLGIGANSAVFSILNAALLREIPYPEADRLVLVPETLNHQMMPVSYPNYLDWKNQNRVFDRMAAFSDGEYKLSINHIAERIPGEIVTEEYFSLLGITPVLGRTFTAEENRDPGKHPVLLLGYTTWTHHFGSSRAIVGKTVTLNNIAFTVIGILPRGFGGFTGGAEVWLPMAMQDSLDPEMADIHFLQARDIHWHSVIARLSAGASLQQARSQMESIGASIAAVYPQANAGRGVGILPVREMLTGNLRAPLYLLFSAVVFILLIGCLNIANLLLSRATERRTEFALRQALGATRWRLIRQSLVESVFLAALGGLIGLAFSSWATDALLRLLPMNFPDYVTVRLDPAVLLFTAGVSLLTGMVLGLAPVWHKSSSEMNAQLQEGSGRIARGPKRIRSVMIVTEIALALVLMVGAGLMLRSFQRLRSVDTGFNPSNLLTMRFDVPSQKYQGAERVEIARRVLEVAEKMPGVDSAGLNFSDLFIWSGIRRGFTIADRPPLTPEQQDAVYFQDISPNFFRTMQIPLLSGRDFNGRDDASAPLVAIVSESFAKRFWPGKNPIGKRFQYGPPDSGRPWITIVGICGNAKFRNLRQDAGENPLVYVPFSQSEIIKSFSLLVRSKINPLALAPSLKIAIQKIDHDIPVYRVTTVREKIERQTAPDRSYSFLLGCLASLAMALSAIGIYGVISYSVSRRQREIGVRMALGARRRDVVRMVLREGMVLALLGISCGILASLLLTRLISSQLYGVKATDPLTFIVISTILAAVSFLACFLPAGRAAGTDPAITLRYE